MNRDDIELVVRSVARDYLGLRDGDYFDSGLSGAIADKLWFILEAPLEKAWMYDDLCD